MTKEGALNILRDKDITESSELPIAVKALIALELERHTFHIGQRIRHKPTGNLGVFGFHNGHPAVKWDGDSYYVGIMISEWEPV